MQHKSDMNSLADGETSI